MQTQFLIPGFMPFKEAAPRPFIADALGIINGVIYVDPDSTRPPRDSFACQVTTIEGCVLIEDFGGERVYVALTPCGWEYRFISKPTDDLPPGATVLRVMRNNTEEKIFFLRQDSQSFQPRVCRPPQCTSSCRTRMGSLRLIEGDTLVSVEFVPRFQHTPVVAIPVVVADTDADPVLSIQADVLQIFETRFDVRLSHAPNSGGYRLTWAAWV